MRKKKKKSSEHILANTNRKKTGHTGHYVAYYEAFSVIYPRAELGPIFTARVLFRHNNTTTASQRELRTAPTRKQGGKNNESGYLANQK